MNAESTTAEDEAPARRRRRRRRRGLSLRALMALVLALGGAIGWLAHRARLQREAVATIRRAGGEVAYDMRWSPPYRAKHMPGMPPRPAWLDRLIGPDHFETATFVSYGGTGGGVQGDQVLRAACSLPWLETLDVVNTDATDAGAEGLGRLTALRSLNLRVNRRMTARAVRDLGRLTEMRDLSVTSIPLQDDDLAFLRSMPKLECFMLVAKGSSLTDGWLANLEGLSNLRVLEIDDAPVTSAGLAHLHGLRRLVDLRLHRARVTSLEPLSALTGLTTLQLTGSPVTDGDLRALGTLASLRRLDLSDTKVTDAGLDHLRSLPELDDLGLIGTSITDAGLAALATFPVLRRVLLRDSRVTDAAIEAYEESDPRFWVPR